VLLYEGEDGGTGGRVQCRGMDRDDVKLEVVGEVHGAEVVVDAVGGFKEHGDELVGGGRN